jgi:hypothetical protein
MYIGHFAVGFAAKRFAPRTSLGWLIGAALFLDLLWPILVFRRVAGVPVCRRDSRGSTAERDRAGGDRPQRMVDGLVGSVVRSQSRDALNLWSRVTICCP